MLVVAVYRRTLWCVPSRPLLLATVPGRRHPRIRRWRLPDRRLRRHPKGVEQPTEFAIQKPVNDMLEQHHLYNEQNLCTFVADRHPAIPDSQRRTFVLPRATSPRYISWRRNLAKSDSSIIVIDLFQQWLQDYSNERQWILWVSLSLCFSEDEMLYAHTTEDCVSVFTNILELFRLRTSCGSHCGSSLSVAWASLIHHTVHQVQAGLPIHSDTWCENTHLAAISPVVFNCHLQCIAHKTMSGMFSMSQILVNTFVLIDNANIIPTNHVSQPEFLFIYSQPLPRWVWLGYFYFLVAV